MSATNLAMDEYSGTRRSEEGLSYNTLDIGRLQLIIGKYGRSTRPGKKGPSLICL